MIHGEGELLVPAHLNFGRFVLDRLRKAKPDRICLRNCTSGEQLTYTEFTNYAVRLAAALTQLGLGRGDIVMVGGEPRARFLPTEIAVILAGAAYTPMALKCRRSFLIHWLNLTKPKYLICTRLFWESHRDILKSSDFIQILICFDDIEDIELSVENLVASQRHLNVDTFEPAAVSGDDIAVVLFSSGTTGMSKGILLTHLNCIARCDTQMLYGFDSLEVIYLPAVAYCGCYSIFTMYVFLWGGKTIVYSENNLNLKIIQDYRVDVLASGPIFVEELLNANGVNNLSSLKVIYSGTAPVRLLVAKAFKQRYPNIELVNLYGSTEGQRLTGQRPSDVVSNTIGVAAPGVTIKVVDVETRAPLGPNQRGEICVKTPRLMKGYLGATAPYLDEQGFFLTGDLGYYDEQKRFYLADRLNDIIHHLGYKVSPSEIEEILLSHPAVREAAVVGAPAEAGEHPAAFVVLQPGETATETELQDYVAQRVPSYMRLHGGVRFVPELPRIWVGGKVLRWRLREMLNEESRVKS